MYLQGGWEIDESMEEAASRETLEEAGVVGKIEVKFENISFLKQKRQRYCGSSFEL